MAEKSTAEELRDEWQLIQDRPEEDFSIYSFSLLHGFFLLAEDAEKKNGPGWVESEVGLPYDPENGVNYISAVRDGVQDFAKKAYDWVVKKLEALDEGRDYTAYDLETWKNFRRAMNVVNSGYRIYRTLTRKASSKPVLAVPDYEDYIGASEEEFFMLKTEIIEICDSLDPPPPENHFD